MTLGFNLIADLSSFRNTGWSKKAIIKAFSKVASKYVSFIGLLVMGVEFSLCLNGIDFFG